MPICKRCGKRVKKLELFEEQKLCNACISKSLDDFSEAMEIEHERRKKLDDLFKTLKANISKEAAITVRGKVFVGVIKKVTVNSVFLGKKKISACDIEECQGNHCVRCGKPKGKDRIYKDLCKECAGLLH